MRKVKKIEIVQADPEYWYYGLVNRGCEFEITSEGENSYTIAIGGTTDEFCVLKEDVEVIEVFEKE